MVVILLIFFATVFIARIMSGYDSRYNNRKYFIFQNKNIAKVFLPKSGWNRGSKRKKADFNKMTYVGATFYFCNLILILLIPIFLFLIPEIKIHPFEIDSRYIYITVDSLNEKLPLLLSLILLTVEIIFEFLEIISQTLKHNKKGMFILSIFLLIIIAVFGLLQVEEIISTLKEVFS